ncbi:hypothetical protein SBBP2_2540008 [Burkholderiales bacterium]|nr:hypothetical protein SBBP2_2540008 [Burkholderiales bacterium]
MAVHALTIGMMTRTARGHIGCPLTADVFPGDVLRSGTARRADTGCRQHIVAGHVNWYRHCLGNMRLATNRC